MEKKKVFDPPYQLFNNCQEKGCLSNAQIHFSYYLTTHCIHNFSMSATENNLFHVIFRDSARI